MHELGYKYNVKLLDKKLINFNKINNAHINIIDVEFKSTKPFGKISIKSNSYINNCFDVAVELIKKKIVLELLMDQFQKNIF